MKKLLFAMALLFLFGRNAALAEVVSFAGRWPEQLVSAVPANELNHLIPESGYIYFENGRPVNGQAIVRDQNGRGLWCVSMREGKAVISRGKAALLSGEQPVLWTQAWAEGWSEAEASSFGACDSFDLIYSDRRDTWTLVGDEWQIERVLLPVASVLVTERELVWNDEIVFNTQPITLESYNADSFPTSLLQAQQLADINGYGDTSKGLMTCPSGHAFAALFAYPSNQSAVIGCLYPGVEVDVLDMGSGYVQVSIDGVKGWVYRERVLIGSERAAQEPDWGSPASVYTEGSTHYAMLYSGAGLQTTPVAKLSGGFPITVIGQDVDCGWLHVRLSDGTMGWLPVESVAPQGIQLMRIESENDVYRLNLRSEPSTKSTSLGRYYAGGLVRIIYDNDPSNRDGWVRVAIGNKTGWMKLDYLTTDTSSGEYLPPLVAVESETDLMEHESRNSGVLYKLMKGTRVEVLGVNGEWAQIRTRSGLYGFALLSSIGEEPQAADSSAMKLVQACAVSDADGRVSGSLQPGTQVSLIGQRPSSEWQWQDGSWQLIQPEKAWFSTPAGYGYIPMMCVDAMWN